MKLAEHVTRDNWTSMQFYFGNVCLISNRLLPNIWSRRNLIILKLSKPWWYCSLVDENIPKMFITTLVQVAESMEYLVETTKGRRRLEPYVFLFFCWQEWTTRYDRSRLVISIKLIHLDLIPPSIIFYLIKN